MSGQAEGKPAAVPQAAKQAGEIRARWAWVEPSVWSDGMVAALERGVKGDRWFSLIDKVHRGQTLEKAWDKVRSNAGSGGVDGMSVAGFEKGCQTGLLALKEQLKQGRYQPLPVKRVWIPKLGSKEKRPLGIPAVRDRIVQRALLLVMEPIFERDFAAHSYGFRPGRGCKDALRRVDGMLKAGRRWTVDADLKSYYDTMPQAQLMEKVKEKIADGKVLGLIESHLKQGVLETGKGWEPTETGTPQGAIISPLLANIYLDGLDKLMENRGYAMTRYADDFVVQCQSREEAQAALADIRQWVEASGLKLHPQKTRIVDAETEGFEFLGYRFIGGKRYPRDQSIGKLKDAIRRKTRRCGGQSLPAIVASINPVLRGWFEYFKHSHKTVFRPLDGWVRMRLRSILRQRARKKGRGRGSDHQRYPKQYFADHGLYSLVTARWPVCRPP